MKKQVTFAESQTIERLHQDEALPSSPVTNESKMALKHAGMNFNNGLKIYRPTAASSETKIQDVTTIQIPRTMTAAPFLKHTALTPAQKEYLYTIAASYSTAHVRNLITQHYMNVLHRCIGPDRDDLVVMSVTSRENEKQSKSEVSSATKHKRKTNTSAQHPGKSFLPEISNRQRRVSSISASKKRKTKKQTSPKIKRSSRRARIRLLEEEEEEGLNDSLSECLSSLSMGEWDADTFSDL